MQNRQSGKPAGRGFPALLRVLRATERERRPDLFFSRVHPWFLNFLCRIQNHFRGVAGTLGDSAGVDGGGENGGSP